MPELPEVETIRRELLESGLLGRVITGFSVSQQWLVQGRKRPPTRSAESIKGVVVESRVVRVRRYGKYLLCDLSNGRSLLLHMGMSGRLLMGHNGSYPAESASAIFALDGDSCLYFFDTRRFGDIQVLLDSDAFLNQLGPDPLQSSFSVKVLQGRLQGRRAPIKASLCDQRVVAGIGNIYANEVLFHAGIHPLLPGGSLGERQLEGLFLSIGGILGKAVAQGGTTLADGTYRTPLGRNGGYRPQIYSERFRVLEKGKCGEKIDRVCPSCGDNILHLRVGGRGTFFCPRCQPAPAT